MTSKGVANCKICKAYMKCHWTTGNLRAHPTFHAEKSKEPQLAEAEKNIRILCTSVTHSGQGLVSCIASEPKAGKLLILAKLDCSLLDKLCNSHMLIKALAIIK